MRIRAILVSDQSSFIILTSLLHEYLKLRHTRLLSITVQTTSDHLIYAETRKCFIHEIYEAEKRDKRAKCIKAKGNGTLYLMNGLSEVMQLLTPSGSGSTKSENPGNCVVILFYTKFCPGCQTLVPHWNSLARNFVDIKVNCMNYN